MWLNSKQKSIQYNANMKVFQLDSAYVFTQQYRQFVTQSKHSWLLIVITVASHCVLERLAQCKCSGNRRGGRETKQTETMVGRICVPGLRLKHMRTGHYSEDEWRVIYSSRFLLILPRCILTLPSLIILRRTVPFSSQFMMHSGWFVYTVFDKRYAWQVNCSPLQHFLRHCAPLRLPNEWGLSTRGMPSPFILTLHWWSEMKCIIR